MNFEVIDVLKNDFSDKEKRKGILSVIIFIIAGIIAVGYGIYSMNQLANTKTTLDNLFDKENVRSEYVGGKVHYSSSAFYEVDHKMWGLITTSKDYYYILYSEDMKNGIVLKSDKDWYENFNPATHEALKEITLSGKVTLTDYDVQHYLEDKGVAEFGGINLIYKYCIDDGEKSFARACIIAGSSEVLAFLCFFVLVLARNEKIRKIFAVLTTTGFGVMLLCMMGII
ncbi:MAG: hypothetical protein K6G85_01520 [Eubacterium sp.]|nr:hypothetical protein [Eubacterium sp.]